MSDAKRRVLHGVDVDDGYVVFIVAAKRRPFVARLHDHSASGKGSAALLLVLRGDARSTGDAFLGAQEHPGG